MAVFRLKNLQDKSKKSAKVLPNIIHDGALRLIINLRNPSNVIICHALPEKNWMHLQLSHLVLGEILPVTF